MVSSTRVIQQLSEGFAPYAATSNVMAVINRRRERGLPNPVSAKALEAIGITPGNISRTLQALNFLGLIEDDGSFTDRFDRLSQAGDAGGEHRELLGEIIRSAYHKVFTIVDPAQDTDISVHDAFRQFQPEAQRSRMVAFFLGMCEQAGITEPRGKERRADAGQSSKSATQSKPRRQMAQQQPRVIRVPTVEGQQDPPRTDEGDYRLIFAVLQQLPPQRRWTAERRQKWLSAVEATVDLVVDVVDEAPTAQNEEEAR